MKYARPSMKILIWTILLWSITACDLSKSDDLFTAEEAKAELRTAGQQIRENIDEMRGSKAMKTLHYLMTLQSAGDTTGLNPKPDNRDSNRFCLTAFYIKVFEHVGLSEQITSEDNQQGVYRYNFNTGGFDVVDIGGSYLRYIFPADEMAMENRMHNAAFTIENLMFKTVAYLDEQDLITENLLTRATTDLVVNNQTIATFSHEATFSTSGLPLSTDMKLDMLPYQFRLVLSGSGRDYNSTMSLTKNDHPLLNYQLNMRYNTELDDADRYAGQIQMVPLRFEGGINMLRIRSCEHPQALECMNPYLDVQVRQTTYNKKLGDMAYGLQYNPGANKQDTTLVIVYEDGSSEPLSILFDDDQTDMSHLFTRVMKP